MIKYLIVGIAFIALANIVRAQNSCHLRELDLCLASGLASGQNLPKTQADVKKQCSALKEMYDCISNYTKKCSTKSMREFMLGITQQGEAQSWYDEFCDKPASDERDKYLSHSVCLNSAQKNGRQCLTAMTVALDKAITSDIETRIPGMCCAVNRMRQCTNSFVEKECGKEGIKYMNHMVTLVAGTRLPEIACRDYDPSSAECKRLLPPPDAKPDGKKKSASVLSRLLSTYGAIQSGN